MFELSSVTAVFSQTLFGIIDGAYWSVVLNTFPR